MVFYSTELDPDVIICVFRQRGQPYLLYVALAHMHVPLAPPPPPPPPDAVVLTAADHTVYSSSLREMDSLIGAVKKVSDDTDQNNTLIWFTGETWGKCVLISDVLLKKCLSMSVLMCD